MEDIEVDENIGELYSGEMPSESSHEGSILVHRPDISLFYRTPCPGAAKFARRRRSIQPLRVFRKTRLWGKTKNFRLVLIVIIVTIIFSDYISTQVPLNVLLRIFYYLNKRDLLCFMSTCKRFYEVGSDGAFWEFLNLSNKHLSESALHTLLDRRIKVLRLESTSIYSVEFFAWYDLSNVQPCALTHLDLTQAKFSKKEALRKLLNRCYNLQALSLELCDDITDAIGSEIAKNVNLLIFNAIMAKSISPKGMQLILRNCTRLRELNLGWSSFSDDFIHVICNNLPLSLLRLNISGARDLEAMNDDAVLQICKCCPKLEELDLSDNVSLTGTTIDNICDHLLSIKVLSLSRCYGIEPTNFMKLSQLNVLNIYGCVTDEGAEFLRGRLRPAQINESPFSTVARPTVGDSVTSIWRCRTRDWY